RVEGLRRGDPAAVGCDVGRLPATARQAADGAERASGGHVAPPPSVEWLSPAIWTAARGLHRTCFRALNVHGTPHTGFHRLLPASCMSTTIQAGQDGVSTG